MDAYPIASGQSLCEHRRTRTRRALQADPARWPAAAGRPGCAPPLHPRPNADAPGRDEPDDVRDPERCGPGGSIAARRALREPGRARAGRCRGRDGTARQSAAFGDGDGGRGYRDAGDPRHASGCGADREPGRVRGPAADPEPPAALSGRARRGDVPRPHGAHLIATSQRRSAAPIIALLLLSPICGEVLSGSTPIAMFVNPLTLLFLVGLYGLGALLVRELIRSRGLD